MRLLLPLGLFCAGPSLPASWAQDPARVGSGDSLVTVGVAVRHDTLPVEAALIRSGRVVRYTDSRGRAELRLPAGERQIVAAKIGFKAETLLVSLRLGADTSVALHLTQLPAELAELVVSTTRTDRRIQDEPLRVEILTQEEVEEKLRMTPGDITMMLNETPGLRVQTTSPSLGGANVRVQGLRGRYTQILADGLPLYGGQTGGLGLLQIPPLDLGGAEVIKGVASALYGGSALGGVINLLSRRPGADPTRELLLNQTTLGGTDAVGFASDRLGKHWGYTVLAGTHRQSRVDRDEDGWTDVASYRRAVLRPRAFWNHPRGHSVMLTSGATLEGREGGTMEGALDPSGSPYPEQLRTTRVDAGGVGRFRISGPAILSVRGSAALQRHRHIFGEVRERDQHITWFGEAALSLPRGASHWVVGLAVQEERYRASDVAGFDFSFTAPGLFAQYTVDLQESLALSASARVDRHSAYGTQWSPRISVLARLAPRWSLRTSAGTGYFGPTPFTEETEVIGLDPLAPLQLDRAERAWGGSIDLAGPLATLGAPVDVVVTGFASLVEHPVGLRRVGSGPDQVELVNLSGPTRTAGGELLLQWHPEPFHVTASYTLVRSTEEDPETGERREAPLIPRQQAGLLVGWEAEGRARIGVEAYYTGRQALSDNPYRTKSQPYLHLGVLVERRFGPVRVYLNVENVLDYRQTRSDPLLLPARGPGGRWTTDVWGPLDGRVANIGVRLGTR